MIEQVVQDIGIGFDGIIEAYTSLPSALKDSSKYPPHKVSKVSPTRYEVQVVMGGYSVEDIKIELTDMVMKVKVEPKDDVFFNPIDSNVYMIFLVSRNLQLEKTKVENGVLFMSFVNNQKEVRKVNVDFEKDLMQSSDAKEEVVSTKVLLIEKEPVAPLMVEAPVAPLPSKPIVEEEGPVTSTNVYKDPEPVITPVSPPVSFVEEELPKTTTNVYDIVPVPPAEDATPVIVNAENIAVPTTEVTVPPVMTPVVDAVVTIPDLVNTVSTEPQVTIDLHPAEVVSQTADVIVVPTSDPEKADIAVAVEPKAVEALNDLGIDVKEAVTAAVEAAAPELPKVEEAVVKSEVTVSEMTLPETKIEVPTVSSSIEQPVSTLSDNPVSVDSEKDLPQVVENMVQPSTPEVPVDVPVAVEASVNVVPTEIVLSSVKSTPVEAPSEVPVQEQSTPEPVVLSPEVPVQELVMVPIEEPVAVVVPEIPVVPVEAAPVEPQPVVSEASEPVVDVPVVSSPEPTVPLVDNSAPLPEEVNSVPQPDVSQIEPSPNNVQNVVEVVLEPVNQVIESDVPKVEEKQDILPVEVQSLEAVQLNEPSQVLNEPSPVENPSTPEPVATIVPEVLVEEPKVSEASTILASETPVLPENKTVEEVSEVSMNQSETSTVNLEPVVEEPAVPLVDTPILEPLPPVAEVVPTQELQIPTPEVVEASPPDQPKPQVSEDISVPEPSVVEPQIEVAPVPASPEVVSDTISSSVNAPVVNELSEVHQPEAPVTPTEPVSPVVAEVVAPVPSQPEIPVIPEIVPEQVSVPSQSEPQVEPSQPSTLDTPVVAETSLAQETVAVQEVSPEPAISTTVETPVNNEIPANTVPENVIVSFDVPVESTEPSANVT